MPSWKLGNIFFLTLLITGLFFLAQIALADQPSVTNSESCKKLTNPTQPFMLILKRGENIMHAITRCANDAKLKGASLTGLGAIENPKIGYFNLKKKDYIWHQFSGVFELISLNGDIALLDNAPFVHLHVAFADRKYRVMGGHLSDGIVGATCEITVIPMQNYLQRQQDKKAGLTLISTE